MKLVFSTFAFALSSILILAGESRAASSICEETAAIYYRICTGLSALCPELQSPKACDDTSIYILTLCETGDPDYLEIADSIFDEFERMVRECRKRRIGGDRDRRLS